MFTTTKQNMWLLVHTGFAFAFIIQSFSIIKDLIKPTQTTINVEEKSLKTLPVLFKICVNPAFDVGLLKEEGYNNMLDYFLGKIWDGNTTRYGWGGKYSKTAKELYNRVKAHNNVSDIIQELNVYFNMNYTAVRLDKSSVLQVRRPNYPNNCFTLDLMKHDQLGQKGVREDFKKVNQINTFQL